MKLTDVVNRINGNVDRFTTDLEYYIGGEHFDSNELEVTKKGILKENLGKLGFKFHFAFQDRDVIFMARNPHLRKAGMVRFSGLCSDASYILRSKDESVITQDYLAILLQSDHFWNYCESHKVGSVNFANNWTSIANYEFELPSIKHQKEISKKVWAAYRLKKSYKKLLSATEEMVKSQFIEMFEGNKYPHMSLEEISIEWLKGQPFKKDDIIVNGATPCIHYGELFIKYGPIINDVSSTTNISPKKTSKAGDILFPASDVTPNGLARCSMLSIDNVILGGDIIVLRPNNEYDPGYLSYAINQQTSQLLKRVNGGVVKHLSAKALKTVQIPIPPKDKQEEYISIAEQADKSGFELRKSIDAIDAVIKSLINN